MDSHLPKQYKMALPNLKDATGRELGSAQGSDVPGSLFSALSVFCSLLQWDPHKIHDHQNWAKAMGVQLYVNSQFSTKSHHKPILTARDQHISSKSRHGRDAKILKPMSKQDST